MQFKFSWICLKQRYTKKNLLFIVSSNVTKEPILTLSGTLKLYSPPAASAGVLIVSPTWTVVVILLFYEAVIINCHCNINLLEVWNKVCYSELVLSVVLSLPYLCSDCFPNQHEKTFWEQLLLREKTTTYLGIHSLYLCYWRIIAEVLWTLGHLHCSVKTVLWSKERLPSRTHTATEQEK